MNTNNPVNPRCTATNRSGNRCGNRPIPGGTVCHLHGGGAPQVIEKARQRLLEAIDPAVVKLINIATKNKDVSDKDRLRAIKEILDRGGLAVEHKHSVRGEVEVSVAAESRAKLRDLLGDD